MSSDSATSWQKRFDELRHYMNEHGDCLVPARYSKNPRLGHWVMAQRRQYALLMQGKPSSLCEERVVKLEEVGFAWRVRESNDTLWWIRFMELKKYKDDFGDCLVPQRYAANPPLGIWVSTQRRHYKLLKSGKKSIMTRDRVCELEKIGFEWDLQDSSRRRKACTAGKVDSCKSTSSSERVIVPQPSATEEKTCVSLPGRVHLQQAVQFIPCPSHGSEISNLSFRPHRIDSISGFSRQPPHSILYQPITQPLGAVLGQHDEYRTALGDGRVVCDRTPLGNGRVVCEIQNVKLVDHGGNVPVRVLYKAPATNYVPRSAIARTFVYN